jgi:hypothetical protein
MSLSEYVRYENIFNSGFQTYQRKTTRDEWTERFEFVYKCSKEYIALSKSVNDAYINYIVYTNKHLYTSDKETTSAMRLQLSKVYHEEYNKQYKLKVPIIKAFKERFPNINNSASELEHYLDSCNEYESHRLKGIHYNLPFPLEPDVIPLPVNDFQVKVEESRPVEHKVPQKPEGKWEDLKVIRTVSKPLIIKEKKKYPKKHTLSILLTQEKEKTRKLQEILGNIDSK